MTTTSYTQRVLTIVRTMTALGWDKRRAVRFAIRKIQQDPKGVQAKTTKSNSARSEVALEYLTHKNYTTAGAR